MGAPHFSPKVSQAGSIIWSWNSEREWRQNSGLLTENRTFPSYCRTRYLWSMWSKFWKITAPCLIIGSIFHQMRGTTEVLFGVGTEKGNEVKTVVWFRRIAHFPVNVGQGTSDLCGQNFAQQNHNQFFSLVSIQRSGTRVNFTSSPKSAIFFPASSPT